MNDRDPKPGEEIVYVVNAGGTVHSVGASHSAAKVAQGGGDRGERMTFAGMRLATPHEIARAKRAGVV